MAKATQSKNTQPERRMFAKDLNPATERLLRIILEKNDVQWLADAGYGTPEEATIMLRCYELACLPWWDADAMADAATIPSEDMGLPAFHGNRGEIKRSIMLAIQGGDVAELVRPMEGRTALRRLRIPIPDELDAAIVYFHQLGRFRPAPAREASQVDVNGAVPVRNAAGHVSHVAAVAGLGNKATPQAEPDWIAKARELAKEYIDRHKKQNLFPSQADVCGHVETMMRDARIYGVHGKPVSAQYIGRNAIQGEWWRQNKP